VEGELGQVEVEQELEQVEVELGQVEVERELEQEEQAQGLEYNRLRCRRYRK